MGSRSLEDWKAAVEEALEEIKKAGNNQKWSNL